MAGAPDSRALCPTCGSRVGRGKLVVDLNSNTVTRGRTTKRLQPKQIEMLHILLEAFPRALRYEVLIAKLWGGHGVRQPENPLGCIRTYVYRVRQVLTEFGGYELDTLRGAYGFNSGGVRLIRVEHCRPGDNPSADPLPLLAA